MQILEEAQGKFRALSVNTLLSGHPSLDPARSEILGYLSHQCSHSQGLPSNQNKHLPIRRAKSSYYGYQYMRCTNPLAAIAVP